MRISPSGLHLPGPSRRNVLRGAGSAALLAGGIPLLSACGGSGSSSSDSKTVSVGSNDSDAVPKKAYAAVYADF
ncbi:carbohydrate ABC transporter substrate-binding protein, partial [Streptomyces sp. NPDC091215]